MKDFMRNWQHIDDVEQQDVHIKYLEIAQASLPFQQLRKKVCDLLEDINGGVGIDVGCGLGLAVYELTERGLNVTGVDISQTFLNIAAQRYPHHKFCFGDMCNLPFDDSTLDFYRAERVYTQLSKQKTEPALAEAYRILKPGGKIVLAEPDLDTIVFTCSDANRDLQRTIVTVMADVQQNGHAGSFLRGQLFKAGFTDISVVAHTLVYTEPDLACAVALDVAFQVALDQGKLTQELLQELRLDMDEFRQRNAFQYSSTIYIICAHR